MRTNAYKQPSTEKEKGSAAKSAGVIRLPFHPFTIKRLPCTWIRFAVRNDRKSIDLLSRLSSKEESG